MEDGGKLHADVLHHYHYHHWAQYRINDALPPIAEDKMAKYPTALRPPGPRGTVLETFR